jgi:outer membrane murein-binding lipoprotein Lpp
MKDKSVTLLRLIAVMIAVIMIAVCVFSGFAIKRINAAAKTVNDMGQKVNELSAELDKVDWNSLSKGVNNVSSQLSELDLEGFSKDVEKLTKSAQDGIETASKAIQAFDIEALNRTVKALEAISEPLAKLVSFFNR